ncbi:MAG: hypothetical protein Q8Q60_05225 [Candidatus Chromulinivorax sp.]|nr:hypothetical protein [Candidatus Chromulinivorax sp.]
MKIKYKFFMYLLITSLSSSIIMPSSQTYSSPKYKEYFPIASYQKMLSDMISNYIMSFLYKKTPENKKMITMVTEEDIPKSDRDEALAAMKVISTKLFDLNDTDSLSAHLLALKALCDHLNPNIDQKTITAIHFLLENQHRTGTANIMFWMSANSKYGLENALPMTQEIEKRPRAVKLAAINKKMTLQAQKLKEQGNTSQTANLPVLV